MSRVQRNVSLSILASLFVASAAPGVDAPARRRALLIGVNEYTSESIPDLRGAVNDVELLRGVLTSRHGFEAEDVQLLLDADATRQGIFDALEALVARSGPNDVVYVHYSGHGSQVRDQNEDEAADGFDETLVPHDGRTPGVADITDDELSEILGRFRTSRVVVVLDSCHSGTATRSVSALAARFVPRDERAALYAGKSREVVSLTESGHLLMTGAADDQQALDGPVDGRQYGFFSFSLARALSRAPADASPRSVFAEVQRELERIKGQLGLRSLPSPQLEAPSDRLDAPLWARRAADAPAPPARLAFVVARPVDPRQVRLEGGLAMGAVVGSVWALYPADEDRFEPGEALARVEIDRIDGGDALGRPEPEDATLPDAARAVAVSPPPPEGRVAVRLHDEDEARRKRLEASIAESLGAVDFVGPGHFARFEVSIDGERCRVLGADGETVLEELVVRSEAQLATALAAIFARSMSVAELLSLDHPAAAIDLTLAWVGSGPSSSAGDEGGTALVASNAAAKARIRKEGEPRTAENSLQVRVRASTACRLTLVDVDSEGGVNLLFPNRWSEKRGFLSNGLVPADAWVTIPDSFDSDNEAGFHVDFSEPAGADTLRAFCMEDAAQAERLRSSLARLAGGAEMVSRGAVRAVLVDEIRDGLSQSAVRGMRLRPSEPTEPAADAKPGEAAETAASVAPAPGSDWAAASLQIEVGH